MFHINVISSHEYQKDIAKQSEEEGEEKNGEYGCSRYYTKLIQWPTSISPTISFGQLNFQKHATATVLVHTLTLQQVVKMI